MTSPEFTDPQAIARNAADAIRSRLSLTSVDMGLVLGSGWSAGVDRLGTTLGRIPLSELPGFFAPVVAGHGGDLVAVALPSGKTAVVLTGRTHFYEGRGVEPVVHGVRTVAALGATTMILTNGCGGLDPSWGPGTIVAIRDHINLTGATPLRGATFIDMSTAWTPRLLEVTERVAPGTIGADLVGMSTALEAIAAREAGLDLLGLSLVTNHAAGVTDAPLDHAEVIAAGKQAAPRLASLLADITAAI